MPRPKSVDTLAQELLELSDKESTDARRPNLRLDEEKVKAIRKACENSSDHQLTIELSKVVEWLGLSPSYSDPKRAFYTASSLSRRLADFGIRCGAVGHGRYLRFRLVGQRRLRIQD